MSSKTNFSPQCLVDVLDNRFAISDGGTVYVGYSGGADSSALLHALCQIQRFRIVAAHVHHGHIHADAWLQHCVDRCRDWGVECVQKKIVIDNESGLGWEGSARNARYRWFATLLQAEDVIVTAHHLQDQAETVLANLLRGSGVTGLSGIPRQRVLGKGRVLRPLLDFAPEDLRDYLRANALNWMEDPSNADVRYKRNLIRQQILPVLKRYWPAATATLANTANRLRQIDDLLLELGKTDLLTACSRADVVSVTALRALSGARQINLLRAWLQERGVPRPSEKRIAQVLEQLIGRDPAPTAAITWGDYSLRRYRDGLYLVVGQAGGRNRRFTWDMTTPLRLEPLSRELHVIRSVPGRGLAEERLTQPLSVRWRQGGEVCRLPGRRHHSRLKKLFQNAGVPPWERSQIPLLYCGDELAAVVGHWYCEPFAARESELGTEVVIKPS